MSHTAIQATDTIEIEASQTAIWKILLDLPGYPSWWPKSLGVRLLSRSPTATGSELEIRPFGGRPFRCRVEGVREMESIQMRYCGGFVEGSGEWLIEQAGKRTRVMYRLDVVARGRLVRILSKLLDLSAIHSRAMDKVLQNLRTLAQSQRT